VKRLALFASLACAGVVSGAENLSAALGAQWKQLPDWRGVWYLEEPLVFAGPPHAVIARSTAATATDATAAAAATNGRKFEHGITPGSSFTGAPYKPEYQKLYDERVAKARSTGVADDPIENCYSPHGMPRVMGAAPGAVEFHVTPKQTWIIWDFMNQTRRIRTDGSGPPSEDMKWPRTMGISYGKWEGQTLVVETMWMKGGVFDRTGAPYSEELRITERITRTDPQTLTVEMTLEDPVMFTKPWNVTRHFKKSAKKGENVRGTYCDYDPAAEPPK